MRALIIVAALLAAGLSSAAAGSFYDRNDNLIGTTTRNSDGSMSVNGGSNRTFVNRNGARTYDSTGRLVAYSIQRGNVLRVYDSSGRLTNRAVIRRTTTGHTIDDKGGRFYAR